VGVPIFQPMRKKALQKGELYIHWGSEGLQIA
jgi:hypothetical protein